MFEANPIPARDSEGSNKPCAHQDPEIPQRLNQTVFECLLRKYRSAVDCCRNRGSECSRPRNGISFLEEVAITPTIEPPKLEQDSWRTQTKSCVQQDLGERNSDPTRG